MAKIKVTVIQESEEHAEWQKSVDLIETISPEDRTDEQWNELAKLNETEPECGDSARDYYIPTFDTAPATLLQRIPKHLFDKSGVIGIDQAVDFTMAYLALFMPKHDVGKLTISQINEIGAMLKPAGEQ